MRIAVSHLTRMDSGYICVAGLDPGSGQHIRPELANTRVPVRLLARNGGPFDIGNVVDVGPTQALGRSPEVEDQRCYERNFVSLPALKGGAFWNLLSSQTKCDLLAIFGQRMSAQIEAAFGKLTPDLSTAPASPEPG